MIRGGPSAARRNRAGSRTRKVTVDELVAELHETVDGLAADGTDRGDLKLVARTLRELRTAFRVFAENGGRRRVVVFGSARVAPGQPSYRQAEAFGREMASRGWFIVTGAGGGVMEAAHLGAGPELSMGVNILLPFEQPDNSVIAGSPRLVSVKYFFTRKLLFLKEAHGVVLFPGGYGTMDEAFEALTLLQTGKSHLFPVVLVDAPGGDYWRRWRGFVEDNLLARGLISAEDASLFRITDDVAVAAREVADFYRVYHSMRYVGPDLVVRLAAPLPAPAIDAVNERFADILSSGRFTQTAALADEADEPSLADLPRLVFRFNRRSFGRLRLLVDFLNGVGTDV